VRADLGGENGFGFSLPDDVLVEIGFELFGFEIEMKVVATFIGSKLVFPISSTRSLSKL
jgi:hypothetical protein